MRIGRAIRLLRESRKGDWESRYIAGTLLNSLDKAVESGIASPDDDLSTLVRRVSSGG